MKIDLIASLFWKGIYILITRLVPFKFVLDVSSENHLVVKGKMSILPRLVLYIYTLHDSKYSCICSSYTMRLLQLTCWRRPCSIERLVKRLKIAYQTSSIIVTDDWFSWQPGLYLADFLHLGPHHLTKVRRQFTLLHRGSDNSPLGQHFFIICFTGPPTLFLWKK